MAKWPFGKKKDQVDLPEVKDSGLSTTPAEPSVTADAPAETVEPAAPVDETPAHDAVNGESGPFDGDNVDIEEFDFTEYSTGILNLGSMKIPLPKGSQVQVEMGEAGPRMLHIVTPVGRITPVAFAAPTQGGQWASASQEISDGMRGDGMPSTFESGPWGPEVVGSAGDNTMRIIGIDGPRWMLRLTLASATETAGELADLARGLAARIFVYRGDTPVLAGNSLPVSLPPQLVEQVQQAMQQREEQARIQQQSDQAAAQRHDEQAVNDAAEALRNLGRGNGPAQS